MMQPQFEGEGTGGQHTLKGRNLWSLMSTGDGSSAALNNGGAWASFHASLFCLLRLPLLDDFPFIQD
jgi:hypothetical protein